MANHFSRFIGLLGMGLIASTAGAAGCLFPGDGLAPPEVCSDRVDNDNDAKVDCADSECRDDPACGGTSTSTGTGGSTTAASSSSSAATGTGGGTSASSTATSGSTASTGTGMMPACDTATIEGGDPYEWFVVNTVLGVVTNRSSATPNIVNETGTSSFGLGQNEVVVVQVLAPYSVGFSLPAGCPLTAVGRGTQFSVSLSEGTVISWVADMALWSDVSVVDTDPALERFSGAQGYPVPLNDSTAYLFAP